MGPQRPDTCIICPGYCPPKTVRCGPEKHGAINNREAQNICGSLALAQSAPPLIRHCVKAQNTQSTRSSTLRFVCPARFFTRPVDTDIVSYTILSFSRVFNCLNATQFLFMIPKAVNVQKNVFCKRVCT